MFAAVIPIENMVAANEALSQWGNRSFTVPVWADSSHSPTYVGLHYQGGNAALEAAIKSLPGVQISEISGTPREQFADALSKVNAQWAETFPLLEGQVVAGEYRKTEDYRVYLIVQSHDRDLQSHFDPDDVPALYTRVRIPGEVTEWVQPLSTGGYWLENPFTGKPDRVTYNGNTWEVAQANAGGRNTFSPIAWPAGWRLVE